MTAGCEPLACSELASNLVKRIVRLLLTGMGVLIALEVNGR